jgi:endonuclease/exonuclease/phosphatase family metal-dependent hydrolase
VAWLGLLDPDLVCLQEVMQAPDGRNQAHWIAEAHASAGGGAVHVAYGPGGDIGGHLFGNAVLSRWPIEAVDVTPLPSSNFDDDVARAVLHARTNGVDVFCTHLAWRYDDGALREQQVQVLADTVASQSDSESWLPPVVAGDFNADPDSTEMRFLTGLTSLGGRSVFFQDAWRTAGGREPGWTWDNRNPFAAAEWEPDRRIDYVLLGWRHGSGAAVVTSARVVCDRALTGTHASDHFGLLADIARRLPEGTESGSA